MKKAFKISAALFLAAILGVGGYFAWQYYYDRKVPNFRSSSELFIRPDTPVDSVVAQLLRSSDVVRPASVRRVFRKVDSVKPGHYTVSAKDPSIYVARMVHAGWQTPVKLVLSGTLRRQQDLASKISRQMMLDSIDVIRALRDSALLASYGFRTEDVFALFFPDTYEVWWTDPMTAVLDKQKAAYDAFWTEDNLRKAAAQGLTQREVPILASIVKGETNYEPEMPSIAGVYLNRLHKGMKLQADPTIAYCFDYELDRVLKKHLEVDSPFNTYKNFGLPPAPIYVPTRAALEAVLNPDRHGYIFFCASPEFNGTHRFAVTYSEHLTNAREFQRALTARRAAKK